MEVQHDEIARHFILAIPEGEAVLDYERASDGRVIFTHTLVPTALRGRGIGELLARAALTWAQKGNFVVEVHCPYVAHFLEKHSEFTTSIK